MIDAELIITLRKRNVPEIRLYSFTYEGVEHVLTEQEIKKFECRYNLKVRLKEEKSLSYNLEDNFQNIESISNFFNDDPKND